MIMLKLIDIHKTFNPGTINEKVALNGVDLHLNEGDFVTVIGGNGAGKSTIVKLICGLYQPTEGNITINGIPLGSLNPAQYYKAIAAVFLGPVCTLVFDCRK